MITLLQHFALTENIDNVRLLDGRETMGHGDGCSALGYALEGGLNEFFAFYFPNFISKPVWLVGK